MDLSDGLKRSERFLKVLILGILEKAKQKNNSLEYRLQ